MRLEKLQEVCATNGILVQEDDGEEFEREKLADEYAIRVDSLQKDNELKETALRTLREEN